MTSRNTVVTICARVVVLALPFLTLHCFTDRLDPVLPSWDADLTVPLANRVYTLFDVMQRQPATFHADGGNQLIYTADLDARPVSVGDAVALDPIGATQSVELGAFSLSTPAFTLPIPLPWLPPGSRAIQDTTVSYPAANDTISTFLNVTVASGIMSLTLKNSLPVPVTILDPLFVSDGAGVVATFVFPANGNVIPSGGGSVTTSFSIAGKTFNHALQFSGLRFHVGGSVGPVTIPASPLITASVSVVNFKVRRAVLAQIPPQRLTRNDSAIVVLNDSTIVNDLIIKRGTINLSFKNRINLGIRFVYRFNEILRPGSRGYVPYEDSLFLSPLASDSRVVDLSGFRIHSPNGGLVRSLGVVSSMILPNGSNANVTVSDTDKVEVALNRGTTVIADSATGILRPTWITIDAPVPLPLGEIPSRFRGTLNIPAAQLTLRTFTSIGFPLDAHIHLAGINPTNGRQIVLNMPTPGRRIQPGVDSIAFDPAAVGTFLSQFAGRIPDSIHIVGSMLINPPDSYASGFIGAIGSRGTVRGSVHLEVPLKFGIDTNSTYRDTVAIGDTTGSGLRSYSLNKDRINGVNTGVLSIDVLNATPLQVEVDVQLLNILKQPVLIVPQQGRPRVVVNAGQIDNDGNLLVPAHSTATISLTEAEVRQFNPAEYLSQTLVLRTAGTSLVRLRTTDYVHIRLWSGLSYRVNK